MKNTNQDHVFIAGVTFLDEKCPLATVFGVFENKKDAEDTIDYIQKKHHGIPNHFFYVKRYIIL